MPRSKPITAAELLALLASDPEHQAAVAKRDSRIADLAKEFAAEDQAICKEVHTVGYEIHSVWDFVNNSTHPYIERPFTGSYELAYPILVRHLSVPHHHRVREGIIRALTVRDGGETVWSALLAEYEKEPDTDLKWVLANALKIAMPLKLRKKHPEISETYRAKGAP